MSSRLGRNLQMQPRDWMSRRVEAKSDPSHGVQGDALQLCALVDVASAFAITAMIVFHRSIFLPFVYINQLRTRYKSADSRDRHQAAWRTIGTYVNPLIEKVPALEMPVGYAKNWFTSA